MWGCLSELRTATQKERSRIYHVFFYNLSMKSANEPWVLQESFATVQNLSCMLQYWDDVMFWQKHSHYNCSAKGNQQGIIQDRRPDLWFWYCSGSERLSNPLPLSEDSVSGTCPLSRPSETILIWSAWTKDNLCPEHRISQEQSQEVRSNTHLWSEVWHKDLVL